LLHCTKVLETPSQNRRTMAAILEVHVCYVLIVALLSASLCAFAQQPPRDVVAFSATVARITNTPGITFVGFAASTNHNFTDHFGVEGEFDLLHHFGPDSDSNTPVLALGGPRVQFTSASRVVPYFHGLGGISYSGFLKETNAAVFGGGGVDIRLTRSISLREGADYGWVNTTGVAQNGFRAVSGIAFTFGGGFSRSQVRSSAKATAAAPQKSQAEQDEDRLRQWWPDKTKQPDKPKQ